MRWFCVSVMNARICTQVCILCRVVYLNSLALSVHILHKCVVHGLIVAPCLHCMHACEFNFVNPCRGKNSYFLLFRYGSSKAKNNELFGVLSTSLSMFIPVHRFSVHGF